MDAYELTSPERKLVMWYKCKELFEKGLTKAQIAEQLHVHKSTISREIRRNGYSRYRVYKPKIAQARAEYRWLHRKLPRRFKEDVKVLLRRLRRQRTALILAESSKYMQIPLKINTFGQQM